MSDFDLSHHGDEVQVFVKTEADSWRAKVKKQIGIGEFRSFILQAPTQNLLIELIRMVLK